MHQCQYQFSWSFREVIHCVYHSRFTASHSNESMSNIDWRSLYTKDEIEEMFTPPGEAMTAQKYYEACGRPRGPAAILLIATQPPPPKYNSREEAQAAGAVPGARTAHWLCVAIIAKAAYESRVRVDDGRRGGLHTMWRSHACFDEFAELCLR